MANPKSGWNQQLQDLGFESLSDFTEALFSGWTRTFGLYTCALMWRSPKAAASTRLGAHRRCSCSSWCRSLMGLPSTRNLSRLFQLKARSLFTLEDHFSKVPGCRGDWERGAPVRAAMDERFALHPLYAGALPILLSIEGFNMTQIMHFPQMRPDPMWLPGAAILAEARHIVLEDILNLLVGSINEGFPLRSVDSDPRVPLLPGRFVRNNRTWTWQLLFADWSHYRRGQHRGLDQTLDEMKFGFSPPELMLAFKSLVF
ncbi:hypothetical protein C8T65DRAFT_700591 [Cerioporus squamosus]|nr:hypothetical protein C8T65DRAFT_700591 [Cerioporus squamosus]